MGKNCNTCCSNKDQESEFVDGGLEGSNGKGAKGGLRQSREFRNSKTSLHAVNGNSKSQSMLVSMNTNDIVKLTRMQSLIRGFLERRRYRTLNRELQMKSGIYFKKEEYYETIQQGQKYNPY